MNKLVLAVAVTSLAAIGCAHQQTQQTTQEEKPVAAAPKPQPPPADPAPTQAQDDVNKLLSGTMIHFDFDRADLTDSSRDRLTALADVLKKHSELRIRIDGNCDEAGTEEYNLALGQKRADAARQYLSTLGVSPNRLETVTYGKEKPLDPAHNQAAWSQNRRDGFTAQ
jgi:peptidoglycan-associated lipoprotein